MRPSPQKAEHASSPCASAGDAIIVVSPSDDVAPVWMSSTWRVDQWTTRCPTPRKKVNTNNPVKQKVAKWRPHQMWALPPPNPVSPSVAIIKPRKAAKWRTQALIFSSRYEEHIIRAHLTKAESATKPCDVTGKCVGIAQSGLAPINAHALATLMNANLMVGLMTGCTQASLVQAPHVLVQQDVASAATEDNAGLDMLAMLGVERALSPTQWDRDTGANCSSNSLRSDSLSGGDESDRESGMRPADALQQLASHSLRNS